MAARKGVPWKARPIESRECVACGRVYTAYRKNQRFCSIPCCRSSTAAVNRQARREQHVQRVFGLDPLAYRQMLDSQGCACAICDKAIGQESGDHHIDHDHNSGVIRGILCFSCNAGLGQFRDRADLLESAALYLRLKARQREPLKIVSFK